MRDIEKYTQEYQHDDFELKYQVKYRRKQVLECLRRHSHESILEIGCGMEPLALHLDDFQRYTIVEPSKDFLCHAEEVLQGKSERMEFWAGRLEEFTQRLAGKHFDFILCSGLLHEVEQLEVFLADVISLCDASTVVHVNVPNANSFHRLLAVEAGLIPSVQTFSDKNVSLQIRRIFDMESLLNLLEQAATQAGKKLAVLDKGSFFVKPFTHKQMTECLAQGIIDERVLDGLYQMTRYLPKLGSEIFVDFQLA